VPQWLELRLVEVIDGDEVGPVEPEIRRTVRVRNR